MAPKSKILNEYERQRLANIRRNDEMMSALLLRRKAADLSSSSLRNPNPKKPKPSPKPQSSPPIVIRRSLRTRGIPPSSASAAAAAAAYSPPKSLPPTSPPRKRGPLLIRDAFVDGPRESDSDLMSAVLGSKAGLDPVRDEGFDPRSELGLKPKNVAKVVSERIMSVRFLPFVDRTMIVVGNKIGNLGFWDLDLDFGEGDGDGDGIYVYQPHSGPVSGISVHPFSPRKIFTSSYDGFVRLMDVEKETFNMLTSSDNTFFSICQWPRDVNSLYIGEGGGMLKVLDEREGKDSNFWQLHEARINTVDFNPENPHLMATSSSDGLACVWDLRSMKKDKPDIINSIGHERAVHAAFFSPSGKFLATTSLDDKVGIASGTNYGDLSMVSHYNQTGRWLSTFRAIWGWDDSYVFIGNMKRAVDVISTINSTAASLDSPDIMTSIPCRFAAHPYKLGHLAGATSGGKVFLWTKES